MTHAKHCPVCNSGQIPRRKRCENCKRHVCGSCIKVTAKDHGGPICNLCAEKIFSMFNRTVTTR